MIPRVQLALVSIWENTENWFKIKKKLDVQKKWPGFPPQMQSTKLRSELEVVQTHMENVLCTLAVLKSKAENLKFTNAV